ncbi:MAG: M28 family peptidase [Gemmatimonadaceae bacterium]|nr:M28 family peptidase [Gemmatimonadaceae bacterium]
MTFNSPRATALAVLVAVGACRTAAPSASITSRAVPDSIRIRDDIGYLASDRLEGRRTGTAGNDSAAAYIARRYAALRLDPTAATASCGRGCAPAYLLPFTAREAVRGEPPRELRTQNIAGIIRGSDRTLAQEFVVVGAHFDHLGRSAVGALDPDAKDAIRNGADDNASGSAVVLALARRLTQHPTKRSILIAHFSGEEQGLLGSAWLADHLPVPLAQVDAMMNFDMVGRLRDDKLIVYGVATAAEMQGILDSANSVSPLKISGVGDGFGPSDHSSFYAKDLPVLHFFTDVHADYHRATDDADKINLGGTVRVVDLAERVIRSIADRPARLTFTKVATTARASSTPSTGSAYFGSIPDMGSADGDGMRISGVSPGGPAEKAGLKGGDLIVEFGGKPIKDIYDYTDAIGAFKPGDEVTVVVLRGPNRDRVVLKVTLTTRGS